jgi:DNA-binding YbaB/EbfC family protein
MFGNLAEMAGIMKKVAEMKSSVEKMKEELSNVELSAKSSGGQVEVVISGDMLLKRVCVNPELLKTGDADAVGSAVQEAANAAIVQMKAEIAKRLSVATGGLSNSFPGLI